MQGLIYIFFHWYICVYTLYAYVYAPKWAKILCPTSHVFGTYFNLWPTFYVHTHTFAYIYINMLNLKPNTSWPKGQKAKTLSIKPNYHLVLKMANKFISHVWFKHLWKLKNLTHGFSFTYFAQIKQIKTCFLFISKNPCNRIIRFHKIANKFKCIWRSSMLHKSIILSHYELFSLNWQIYYWKVFWFNVNSRPFW